MLYCVFTYVRTKYVESSLYTQVQYSTSIVRQTVATGKIDHLPKKTKFIHHNLVESSTYFSLNRKCAWEDSLKFHFIAILLVVSPNLCAKYDTFLSVYLEN